MLKPNLAQFAASFSRSVTNQLNATRREIQRNLDIIEADRKRRARADLAKRRFEAPLIAARLKLAQEGLRRILALGKSEPVQEILESYRLLDNMADHIMLYSASRPSGDAWDNPNLEGPRGSRDVSVEMYHDYVAIGYGSAAVGQGTGWKFFYKFISAEEAARCKEKGYGTNQSDFFAEVANPYPSNLSVVRWPEQRSYMWDEEDVVFQFLVSCARKSQLDRYVVRALTELRRGFAVRTSH